MLLQVTEKGLYCEAGDFYVDPWQPVARAVITHAHADHARPGSKHYLCAETGEQVLRLRMGADAHIETAAFAQPILHNGVTISFPPAGHVLGSAQVRVEHSGEVWVISGDYKTEPDKTCTPFTAVPCHTFITEATFGLPIYLSQRGINLPWLVFMPSFATWLAFIVLGVVQAQVLWIILGLSIAMFASSFVMPHRPRIPDLGADGFYLRHSHSDPGVQVSPSLWLFLALQSFLAFPCLFLAVGVGCVLTCRKSGEESKIQWVWAATAFYVLGGALSMWSRMVLMNR